MDYVHFGSDYPLSYCSADIRIAQHHSGVNYSNKKGFGINVPKPFVHPTFMRFLFAGVVSAIAVYLYNVLSRRVLTMIAAIFCVIAYRAATGRVRAFIIVCHVKASLAHS